MYRFPIDCRSLDIARCAACAEASRTFASPVGRPCEFMHSCTLPSATCTPALAKKLTTSDTVALYGKPRILTTCSAPAPPPPTPPPAGAEADPGIWGGGCALPAPSTRCEDDEEEVLGGASADQPARVPLPTAARPAAAGISAGACAPFAPPAAPLLLAPAEAGRVPVAALPPLAPVRPRPRPRPAWPCAPGPPGPPVTPVTPPAGAGAVGCASAIGEPTRGPILGAGPALGGDIGAGGGGG
mmetsp:Transcript_21431/g.55175  ORF Transcript_21431/g.55175 Transcript_21431/m.55175 type:complete len:242 (-) Transcript_21431:386-1111(-)